jgi:pentatricopeptide repeat protein
VCFWVCLSSHYRRESRAAMGAYRRLIRALTTHSISPLRTTHGGPSSPLFATTTWTRGMRMVATSQAAMDAAAERRRRKRKLRIEPPLNALQRNRDYARREAMSNRNSKLPEPINVLVGDRLSLHNRIQTLCRAGKLDEATLGVKHAMYSNCRPTVFTCNSVLGALTRAGEHDNAVSLFKFIKQAGVIPNLVTYNIVLSTHCERLDLEASFDMLKTIYEAEMTPSTVNFNHLMKAHF